LNRGTAYANLNQLQKAIGDYTEAIRLDPDFAIAYQGRGKAYRAIGNLRAANADLKKAKQLGFRSD
jgi:tetratricopeptide (TPR) repeat protein